MKTIQIYDPALSRKRARNEQRESGEVATRYARRYAVAPLMNFEPAGVQRLLARSGQCAEVT